MVTLTALAIWILSCRIAIISCRLYRSTGHWPVWKERDFAQPEADADAQSADLCVCVDAARIAGHVQAGNADGTARAGQSP